MLIPSLNKEATAEPLRKCKGKLVPTYLHGTQMVPPQQISAGQTLAKVYLKLIVDKVEIGSLVSVLQRDGEAFDKEIKDYLEGSHNIKNIEKLSYEDANGYHVLNANVGVLAQESSNQSPFLLHVQTTQIVGKRRVKRTGTATPGAPGRTKKSRLESGLSQTFTAMIQDQMFWTCFVG